MWQTICIEDLIKKLKINPEMGLTDEQVKIEKEKFGENKLLKSKKESVFVKFIKQFNDFMIITLIIAAGISAIISYVQQTNDYLDSIIIIAIVVLNAIMGTFQENKAEKALEELKKMSSPNAKVKRNGTIKNIESSELVPGDYIYLENGCYVPADVRLVKTYNLKTEESSLTGETVSVAKDANEILEKDTTLAECTNLAFWSTIVVSGHAEAIVTETGMNTKIGKIATMIIENKAPDTPLQIKLGEVGKKLGLAALGICLLIFVIGLIKSIDPIKMFMTAVGLAVAAIPEGLPAIVTIMLSIRSNKNGKEKCYNKKITSSRNLRM